ncbi:MAG: hypothetical protein ABI224_02795 [Acetobacteraceae bacterium]
MRHSMIAAAVLALGCSPAFASDLPSLHPSRDVAVVYHADGTAEAGGVSQSHTIRMFWGEAGQALRVEFDAQPIVALIDFKRQRMEMLIGSRQMVLETKLDPTLVPGFVLPTGAKAVRAGTDTVAGLGCTVWRLTGPRGSGAACITEDGVVLRAEGKAERGSGRLEAVSVTYAPQAASLFAPPAGFARMDLQHLRR